jgi:arylsulfatase A-like enzyme
MFVLSACSSTSEKRPNILFIFADDLGYHDLSITGSKIYQTPNIDNLAKESVTFDNACTFEIRRMDR